MIRRIVFRAYVLFLLGVSWPYCVSLAPVPAPVQRTIALPLVGVAASQPVAAVAPARPFVAWPLRANAQQACTREQAIVVLRAEVLIGTVPVGRAEAWSCASVDEAQAVLDGSIAQIKVQAWCWYKIGQAPAANLACPLRPPEVVAAQERNK